MQLPAQFKITLYLFFFFPVVLFSQSKIDSLRKVASSAESDTVKALALNKLALTLRYNNPDTAFICASQALAHAQKAGAEKIIADIYNVFGLLKDGQSEYDEALGYYGKAEKIYTALNNKKNKAQVYENTGIVYLSKGDYPKALDYSFKGLKLREELHDTAGIASSYLNSGNICYFQGNIDKALEYYLKSLDMYEKLHQRDDLMTGLLGNIGSMYYTKKDYDKTLDYYFKSLALNQEIGNKAGIATDLSNIGTVYTDQKKYFRALEYQQKAFSMFEELGDKSGMGAVCLGIAQLYLEKKKYSDAAQMLAKVKALAEESGDKENLKITYQMFAALYDSTKQYKLAYENHKLFSDIKDTMLNTESSKQITEMQTKYETEKKEQQISLLNKDKEIQEAAINRQQIIIWSVVCGLLIVIVLAGFIFKERRKSEKLLLNILPVETAKELKQKGKASPKHYEQVTVMFTDFKGFTTIAEKLSAEKLVSELDFIFKKFDEIISKYNIEKIKTIGDAYMCASGLPTPNSNHAEEIVKAGIEIQTWMKAQDNKWSLRMGIHSGPVTAGVVGDKKFAYDIWGDTVNTASRMESSGEPGKINISGATHQLIKEKFKCDFRGKIPAKNKREIDMYFVERN